MITLPRGCFLLAHGQGNFHPCLPKTILVKAYFQDMMDDNIAPFILGGVPV